MDCVRRMVRGLLRESGYASRHSRRSPRCAVDRRIHRERTRSSPRSERSDCGAPKHPGWTPRRYTTEGGAIFAAAGVGPIVDHPALGTARPTSYATTLWRWSLASLDSSYARGALIVPIFGGFVGLAGGGTTADRAVFGLYGGALLPGLGVRAPVSSGYTVETTLRATYSGFDLHGDGFAALSRSTLGARIDMRGCSNRSLSLCAGVAADTLASGRAYGISLTTGFFF